AIDQDGGCPDLILTGKEAIDTEGMQTMFRLAALYDIPCANNVVAVNIGSGNTRVESELQGGTTEIYDLTLPCVLGAGRGLNTPKYPTFPDVVKARKKEVKIIELAELSFEKPKGSMAVIELTPLIQNRKVKELSGTKEEIASRIVRILKEEAKVL
ncbi:MAG: electron transfer flavoprotein subunit beta/FixA family protein, partial [Desulfobacteraceae bacterium]|nr:electron transfer flavoprotein subunit beta/FixA family protein [Desulfobacteraceae bacterium]